MIDYQRFAEDAKKKKKEIGKTYREMSEESGIYKITIQRSFAGNPMSTAVMLGLCKYLCLDPLDYYGPKEETHE